MTPTATPTELAPGVIRVTAPNPGAMTGPGTNSYVVGTGPCAVIDPGVDDDAHLAALRAAAPGAIEAILISHAHPDHTGGARRLADAVGAPVLGHATRLAGVRDEALTPDDTLADNDVRAFGEIRLTAVHTPGHAADHLCFFDAASGWLFAGDTIMADVTVVILPPDGLMSDYLASLERLAGLGVTRIAPGHGRVLDDPATVFAEIRAHRLDREDQIRRALDSRQARDPEALVRAIYTDLDARLLPVAAAQVEAHLVRLAELGEAVRDGNGWRVATVPGTSANERE